jgi:predicted amidohydrolase YtcJ
LREPKRSLNPGEPADLCVLKAGFSLEKDSLNEEPVVHTIVNGELLYSASSFKTS